MKDPWFFYIHVSDLHTPIIVPPRFNDKKYGISQYERMVSAIDDWLSQILGYIDTKNTTIILTADHGEYVPVLDTKNGLISLESSDTEKNLWKLGNKFQLFIELYDTKESKVLWTDKWQENWENLSEIQDKLTDSITKVMNKKVLSKSNFVLTISFGFRPP